MQTAGVTMRNHFVVNSLCCPSRAAIFTGQYPHNNGVLANEGPDGGYEGYARRKLQDRSFAVSLQKAGYRTAFMGKYLNGYEADDPEPRGWNDWFGVDGGGYRGFDYTANVNGRQKKFGHLPSDYLTDVLANRGAGFVDDASKKGGPFMLEVATFAPHRPWTPAPRDARRFPGLKHPQTAAFDKQVRNAPTWLQRSPLRARDLRSITNIYRKRVQAVQAVDALITDLRYTLRERGELRNTYFLFTSDNGYHMGEYRLIPGKQTAFDTDIHVPLVVTGPGIRAGSTVDAFSSSIDLAATFEHIAGATPSGERDGVNLVPAWKDQVPSDWQKAVLVEHRGHTTSAPGDPDAQSAEAGDPPSYEAVRTATGLYVEYDTGEKEFHDLRTDPDELDNTYATTPASVLRQYATMLAKLKACKGTEQCQAAVD
ncbi:sulfatase [Jatrophihabitans fulvus]